MRINYITIAEAYPGPIAALSGNTRRALCRIFSVYHLEDCRTIFKKNINL